jgi:hypothetical protein
VGTYVGIDGIRQGRADVLMALVLNKGMETSMVYWESDHKSVVLIHTGREVER